MMQIKICTGCGWLNTKPLGENMYGKPYSACCPDNSYRDVTAVQWLSIMLRDSSKELFDGNIFEQALAMEKEQIVNGFDAGERECQSIWYETGQQYYKEKYGTKDL